MDKLLFKTKGVAGKENHMLEKITNHRVYIEIMSFLAKVFIVLTFFFPAYYSDFKKDMYFIGFLWPYGTLVLLMAMLFLKNCRRKWQNKKFAIPLLILLVVYVGFSFYVNEFHHKWMWEEIHNTIAFAFVGMLMVYPDMLDDLEFDFVKFTMHCIVLTIFCSVVVGLMGYERLEICNNEIQIIKLAERYNENRMSWIYYHKSQFGMMLIVFAGFLYRYRDKFRSIVHFAVAEAIMVAALWLSHSWASLLMAFLIPCGIFMDVLCRKKFWKNKKFWMAAIPLLLAGGAVFVKLFEKMAAERNLLTLGYRIPIWNSSVDYILSHPWGIGKQFGEKLIAIDEVNILNNCHNVFLNAMYRFSIPVGALFILLFFLVIAYAFSRKKDFFAAGYLLAIVAVMTIDYALLSNGVASFFLLVILTLRQERKEDSEIQKVG